MTPMEILVRDLKATNLTCIVDNTILDDPRYNWTLDEMAHHIAIFVHEAMTLDYGFSDFDYDTCVEETRKALSALNLSVLKN